MAAGGIVVAAITGGRMGGSAFKVRTASAGGQERERERPPRWGHASATPAVLAAHTSPSVSHYVFYGTVQPEVMPPLERLAVFLACWAAVMVMFAVWR